MTLQRRHVAIWFRLVIGPAFSRCDNDRCGALLFRARCWTWVEDGARKYGCCSCCFGHARLRGVGAA